jgi:Ice-binding-like/PEP-CTERM motif
MKLARLCLLVFPLFALTAQAQLGSAAMFGVLGASTVTNTGNTVIDGDLGVWPGSSITGFPPGIVNGTIYDGDAVAMQAQLDALAAYNFFQGLSPNQNLTGQNLGGLELTPGVYAYNSSAQLTGELMINWEGLSNQSVVFQIGSTLTTASASMVVSVNAGQNDNIYWNIGSSATLGTTTSFQGTIIADQSATLNTGATDNCGRVIALNGAVTLDDNFIDNCSTGTSGSSGSSGSSSTSGGTVPEPSSLMLFGTGILGLASFLRKKLS